MLISSEEFEQEYISRIAKFKVGEKVKVKRWLRVLNTTDIIQGRYLCPTISGIYKVVYSLENRKGFYSEDKIEQLILQSK